MQANTTKAPAAIRVDLAAICVVRTVSFKMARDFAFARWGRENVETPRVGGRHSGFARSLRKAATKGGSADRAEFPGHISPGSWSGWILDTSGPRTRRHRELCRGPGIHCHIASPPEGKHWFERCLPEPRVRAILRVPTPEEEDRRRRERKALTNERIRHVNRIKGLLFSQGVSGYEPLKGDRRKCLDALITGDGRPLPPAWCRSAASLIASSC